MFVRTMQKPYEGKPFIVFVERVEPERVLSFCWRPYEIEPGVARDDAPTTLVTFELSGAGDGTLMTIDRLRAFVED